MSFYILNLYYISSLVIISNVNLINITNIYQFEFVLVYTKEIKQ